MPFNFGSTGNNTPAPAPSGFGAPAAAGSTAAPAPGAPAAFTFSFVSSSNAGAPASSGGGGAPAAGAPAAGGFANFGGATTPGAAPAANPPASAAPTPGAAPSFGGTPAAPAPASTDPPAPAGAFNFAATSTANTPAAPAPSGLFAPTTTTGPGAPAAAAATGPQLVQVPLFDDTFPGHVLWQKVRPLSQRALRGESLAGQELLQILSDADKDGDKSLGSLLLKSFQVWKNNRTVNDNLRRQLAQQREVVLRGKTATLNEAMLREIIQIADELCLTETEALSLYAMARENAASHVNVCAFARTMYFEERSQFLKTLLFLMQNRLEAADGSLYLQATDALLQKNLVPNLLKHIQEYSKRIHVLGAQINDIEKSAGFATATLSAMSISSSSSVTDQRKEVASSHWKFGIHERQRAAECLFFIAYQTQMEVSEIEALIDAVQFLTNPSQDWPGMPVLHPVEDAPSAYDENDPTAASHSFPPFASTLRREKDSLEWQKDLIARCVASGQVALLRCVSTLVLTGITSMDTRHVLLDRRTHASNASGEGNSLIPVDPSAGLGHLNTLEKKLAPHEEGQKWQRKDVFGLFVAAFGLLLKEAPGALSSPRAGAIAPSTNSWSPSQIRRRLR